MGVLSRGHLTWASFQANLLVLRRVGNGPRHRRPCRCYIPRAGRLWTLWTIEIEVAVRLGGSGMALAVTGAVTELRAIGHVQSGARRPAQKICRDHSYWLGQEMVRELGTRPI
jgi:hypothetical protein